MAGSSGRYLAAGLGNAGAALELPIAVDANGQQYVYTAGPHIDATKGVAYSLEGPFDYKTVAASQTDAVLGNTGALGDIINSIWLIPLTTSPGAVTIKDGSGSAITLYVGGTVSAALQPFQIPMPVNVRSTNGAWKVTTGANLALIIGGIFTA